MTLVGPRRIWVLNAFLAVAAVVLTLSLAGWKIESPIAHLPWWLIAIGFALTEAFVVHLAFRRESESFSLSEIPLVFGLFMLSPLGLVLADVAGAAASLIFRRKQPAVKLVFNLSHFAIESAVAAMIFRAIGDGSFSARSIAAAFVATFVAMVLGVAAVVLAISISEGEFRADMFRRVLGLGWIVSTTNTSLALLGVLVVRTEPALAWLLVVPATTLFFAYRAYTSETQKRRGVEMLYGSTKTLQRALHFEETVQRLLHGARAMFRAETARVTFFADTPGGQAARYTLTPDGALESSMPRLDPREGVWGRVAAEGQSILLPRPIRNQRLRAHYAEDGIRDLMMAPLFRGDTIVGTVVVANRLGDVNTFEADDLRLFETLVNHAGIALVNARLVSHLEAALERQTELVRLKDDFVATVSHELRTPLTSIKGFVKTLLRPGMVEDDEQRLHCLEIIERQSDRLQVMIEDLLLVSQIESDRVHTNWSRVTTSELIAQIADEFMPRTQSHGFRVEGDDVLPVVISDEEIIRRVVGNLIENAVKYSPEGGDVVMRTERAEGAVVIRVTDHGVGIPAGLEEKIFERFFQADQTKTRRAGGAGLGLFISRKLAEAIGAALWLERSSAEGSTFAFRVPVRPNFPFAPRIPDEQDDAQVDVIVRTA